MNKSIVVASLLIIGVSTYFILMRLTPSLPQSSVPIDKTLNKSASNSQSSTYAISHVSQKTSRPSRENEARSVITHSEISTAQPVTSLNSSGVEARTNKASSSEVELNTGIAEAVEDQELDKEKLIFSANQEGIRAAMSEIIPELFECYDAWLKTNDAIEGKMAVSFIIANQEKTGEVDSMGEVHAQVKEANLTVNEVAHPMMEGCLLNSIEGLNFESVDEPIHVKYPFVFTKNQ